MRRLASATLVALLAALGCAATAPAASRLVIKGHGYGHGIGMSQYGAMGYAEHGASYTDILDHYYEQTQVTQLGSAPDVRVLLQQKGKRVVVSGAVAAGSRKLSAGKTYSTQRASGGRVALYSSTGRRMGTYAAPLRLAAPSGGSVKLSGLAANGLSNGRYRGAIEVRPTASGVEAINAVGLEDYVRGVVSAETPAGWPAEALKAQAVAARTYAVTTNVGSTTDGIDQYADTRSQMYKGVAAELPATDAATAATAGQVVTQSGKPVTTYFFSTSGGHTENIEFSFIGALPQTWLKGVDDPYDSVSPRHSWGPITYSQATAQAKLKGLVRGSFRGITVLERGSSPRIVRAEVDGTNGVTQVTGPQLRDRFGLFDTWATFTYISANGKTPKTGAGDGDGDDTTPDDGASTTTPPSTPAPPATNASGGAAPPVPADTTGGEAASIARAPRALLVGTIRPAHRGRTLKVQRDDPDGWRTVGRTTVRRLGRYRTAVPGPGSYRVALGDILGPAVDIR
ncbi:MAG TPA: SpoIID/LytB domain-containing protein [Baekduia sp.]|jgi:stage II sporulation protein D